MKVLLLALAFAHVALASGPHCGSISGSVYTDGTVSGWDPYGGDRCEQMFAEWNSFGLDAVTFVMEHHNFKLSPSYKVTKIPASTIPHASLVRCFSAALNRHMKINLKLQLPDTVKGPKGEFVWRHYYQVDLAGEYYDNVVMPYLSALIEANLMHARAFPQDAPAEVRIIPLHELHIMLCTQPAQTAAMIERLRDDLKTAGVENWKVGFSLDWQFFTDVTPTWDGDVHDVCLHAKDEVGPVLASLDFVGEGAYKPSGGDNGVIDNVQEGADGFTSIYTDAMQTLADYGVADLPFGIAEWNGGGAQPNSWKKPATKPYKYAFKGALNAWADQDLAIDFFTFWNVRSTDKEATDALKILALDIKAFRKGCQ